MAAARFCQSSRSGGSAGTGPSAAVAQAGGWVAVCSPIRSVRASISAAISATYARRSGSARAGTCSDHGRDGSGTTTPSRCRMRASRTAAMSRDPARSRSAIASARTAAGSRPASSAPRRVRHSHFAWWPGGRR